MTDNGLLSRRSVIILKSMSEQVKIFLDRGQSTVELTYDKKVKKMVFKTPFLKKMYVGDMVNYIKDKK